MGGWCGARSGGLAKLRWVETVRCDGEGQVDSNIMVWFWYIHRDSRVQSARNDAVPVSAGSRRWKVEVPVRSNDILIP